MALGDVEIVLVLVAQVIGGDLDGPLSEVVEQGVGRSDPDEGANDEGEEREA